MVTRPLGRLPDIADFRDHKMAVRVQPGVKGVVKLPDAYDRRDSDFGITDQGMLGSCVGHATTGAFRNCLRGLGFTDWQASRLAAYYFARLLGNLPIGEDSGAMIRDGMKGIVKFGAIDENLWPYNEQRFAICPTSPALDSGLKHLGLEYQRVDTTDWDAVRTALYVHKNLTIGITVFDSMMSEKVEQTGAVPLPRVSERLMGGHAVRAVGFTKTMLRCANSWSDWGAYGAGPTKGVRGYFTLPKAYVINPDLCDDAWTWVAVAGAKK